MVEKGFERSVFLGLSERSAPARRPVSLNRYDSPRGVLLGIDCFQ